MHKVDGQDKANGCSGFVVECTKEILSVLWKHSIYMNEFKVQDFTYIFTNYHFREISVYKSIFFSVYWGSFKVILLKNLKIMYFIFFKL
jgi:hypothetical protein